MVTTTLGVSEVSTAVDQRREGIIAKRRDSRYLPGVPASGSRSRTRLIPAIERAMLIALSKRNANLLGKS